MERSETLRQKIVELLENSQEPLSLREISKLASVSEKDLVSHLDHIEKSLKNSGKELLISSAVCRKCGFELKKRRNFKRPSKCSRCRSENISPVSLHIKSS